jgi:hypothetical protein
MGEFAGHGGSMGVLMRNLNHGHIVADRKGRSGSETGVAAGLSGRSTTTRHASPPMIVAT